MDDALHILLKRFRRRLLVAQMARRLGAATLGVAAVCLAAAVIQRFTGTPLLAQAAVCSISVAAIWMVVRLRQRPTLAAAALEVDRQQNLHELLSSAAMSTGQDGFDACVVAAARAKAAMLRADTLHAGSHGASAWVAAFLLGGLLPLVYRAPARAAQGVASETFEAGRVAETRISSPARHSAGDQPRSTAQAQTPGASIMATAVAADVAGESIAVPRPTRSDTAGASAGGGLAQGEQNAPASPTPVMASAQGKPGTDSVSGSGMADAGSSGTLPGAGQVSVTAGQTGTDGNGSAHPEASGQRDAQSIPEGYRDVLKAYFAR